MAAAASRKRPASEGTACPAAMASANKRSRYAFSKIDDYEMVEELGEGTFGVVAKARYRRTGEVVAVKWIRRSSAGGGGDAAWFDAFVREGGCLAACRGHPSVVQIKDVASDEDTGDLYLVTEFVDGYSLRDRLSTRGALSEDAARAVMSQLLSAAARMHAAPMSMIHRDIKPENILVAAGSSGGEEEEVVKICDFGCATPTRPLGTPYPERRVGTLRYSSPEQLIGIRCYGTAVDVWALGCVMTELLLGAPLFTATAEEDMLTQIVDLRDEITVVGLEAFDGVVELSPAGRELLAGLLAFEPGERLTAAEALAHPWFTGKKVVAEPLPVPAAAETESSGSVPMSSSSVVV